LEECLFPVLFSHWKFPTPNITNAKDDRHRVTVFIQFRPRCSSGNSQEVLPQGSSSQLFKVDLILKFALFNLIPSFVNIYWRWEDQGHADKTIWNKAGEYGILGINIPAEYGGLGGSFIDAAIVMEEM